MSLAYYIVLNGEHKDIDTLLSGKALGRSYESIQEAAAELSVTPLGVDAHGLKWHMAIDF